MDRTSAANYADIGGGKRGFRNRNLLTGVRGTMHDAADRNAVQEELLVTIEAAGLTPNAADWTQHLQALHVLFGGGGSLGTTGWQRLPGGLIIQWGNASLPSTWANTSSVAVTLPLAFPTALYVATGSARGTARPGGWVPSVGILLGSLSWISIVGDVLADSAGHEFTQACPVSWFAIGR